MDQIKELLEQGGFALIAIVSMLASWRMYRDKQAAEARLLAKAESWMGKYYQLAESLSVAATALQRRARDDEDTDR